MARRIDSVDGLTASGFNFPGAAFDYRESSPASLPFTAVQDNAFGVGPGKASMAVADGWQGGFVA